MPVAQSTYPATMPIGIAGQIINGETSNRISRTVESAAGLAFGQPAFKGVGDHGCLAGAAFSGTSTAVAGSGNVGNGTMGAVTVTAGAKEGTYTLVITEPGANVGAFEVLDPDGIFVDNGNVASAFSAGGLAFTLADGSTDFSAGDTFSIPVVLGANADFLGLSILSHVVVPAASTPDKYPQYETAALMTQGEMVVMAGATVANQDDVYWNPATSRFTNTATHIRIPNAKFDRAGANGALTVVSLKNRVI